MFGVSKVALVVKNPPANAGDTRLRFDLWVKKVPWSRKWHPIDVILAGESHGQESLVEYNPWGCKRVRHDKVSERHSCLKRV